MTTPLPPTDPQSPDGKLPGETELAALYRQLPQNEPGPTLDAAAQALAAQDIDAAAALERRRSPRERGDWVHPKPESAATVTPIRPREPVARQRGAAPRWLIGLGSAASLVLVAGLAWRMRQLPPASPAPVGQTSGAPATTPTAPSATLDEALPPPAQMRQRAAQSAERLADAPAATPMAKLRGSMNKPAADAAAGHAMGSVTPPVVAAVAVPAPAPAHATAAADAGTVTTASPGDTPTQDLDKIRQLFAQGRDDEARQRLYAFQHAHPQWKLPPELQAQLRQP